MKALPTELKDKLREVHSWMFEGDQDRVAAKSRKTREYVNKVLNQKAFNASIMEAGIEVMNENKARFEIKSKMNVA